MEIVITAGALESLHKNLEFLISKQGVPYAKAMEIQDAIFTKIRQIPKNTMLGQLEENLTNPSKKYRRLIYGN